MLIVLSSVLEFGKVFRIKNKTKKKNRSGANANVFFPLEIEL